jgi:hypothetical protein
MKGGNTRIGVTRARGHGRPTKTVWRRDPVIQARLNLVQGCWSQMMSRSETLLVVNQWAQQYAQPPVTLRTIGVDRRRIQMRAYEREHHLKVRDCHDRDYTFL